MSCDCEFDDDPEDEVGTEALYYRRLCGMCGHFYFSLHCPHDGVQRGCPCGFIPTREVFEEPES
jgi:hypothetical protein